MAGTLVALDIGESQLKLVLYAGGRIKKAAAVPVPDGLVKNGEIVSMDAMADVLRRAAKENGIPRAAAAVLLPQALVYTRTVDVPPMTDAQLCYNLPFEFRDYLTQEKSKYYFDYAVLGHSQTEGGERLQLFACAALKATIEAYRAMLRRAGFRLKLAIPEQSAYAALIRAQKAAQTEDCCFVDLGYNAARLQFLRSDAPVNQRTIGLGLADLVRSVSERRGVDEHLARKYVDAGFEGVLTEPESLELYHRMAVEIMKAVNFYNYNNREKSLQRIYLLGGGALLAPLREAVAEMTRLELHSAAELLPQGQLPQTPELFVRAAGCALQAQEACV